MLAQVQPDVALDLDREAPDLEPAGSNSSATSIDVKAMKKREEDRSAHARLSRDYQCVGESHWPR